LYTSKNSRKMSRIFTIWGPPAPFIASEKSFRKRFIDDAYS